MQVKEPSILLEEYGLRATRPRMAVASVLFGDGCDKHITAEWVAAELQEKGDDVALATVYNTLNNFSQIGLLCELPGANRGAVVFDTNTSAHHHFFNEKTNALTDIPEEQLTILGLPKAPESTSIVSYEIIVRVR